MQDGKDVRRMEEYIRDGNRTLRFRLTRPELLEFSVRTCFTTLWLRRTFFVAAGVILFMGFVMDLIQVLAGGDLLFNLLSMIGKISVFLLVLILLHLTVYIRLVRMGYLEPMVLRVEDGYLFCDKNNSRTPCSYYTYQAATPRVLILGRKVTNVSLEAVPIPKRLFGDRGEMERFMELFRQAPYTEDKEHAGGGRFNLYFVLDNASWSHVFTQMMQAASVIRASYRLKMNMIVIGTAGLCCTAGVISGWIIGNGRAVQFFILFFVLFTLIYCMRGGTVSERTCERLAKRGRLSSDGTGTWEMAYREDGIRVKHGQRMFDCRWEDYQRMAETLDTIFLLHVSAVKTVECLPVPKWVFDSQKEMDEFVDFCQSRGVEKIVISASDGRSRKRTRLFLGILLAAAVLVYMGSAIYRGVRDGMQSVQASVQADMDRESRFDPGDYPDYVPVEIQVEILRSLGIDNLEPDTGQEYKEWMEENPGSRVYTEGFPYYSILSDVGAGEYDDDTYEWSPTSGKVYWFDFEGWDISQDYIDIMKGFQAIGGDDFILTDMKEDMSQADWENGTGTVAVLFSMDGQSYRFQAKMENDWMDGDFIGFFNRALEECGKEKRLYCMGDNGQGAIVFYNTGEWAGEFEAKTGIKLESPTD